MEVRWIAGVGSVLAAAALVACGGDEDQATVTVGSETQASSAGLPQGAEPVELDPADFTTEIDNEFWPMAVGSRWVYEETAGSGPAQRVVVTVTDETKRIANGVEARVVRDVVSEHGKPVEITDDWYAQDAEGNIWYLGERTGEYENGKLVTRAGSFEAGVDGAQAGIIMPADPQPGMAYRQEYYEGEAEDRAVVPVRLVGEAAEEVCVGLRGVHPHLDDRSAGQPVGLPVPVDEPLGERPTTLRNDVPVRGRRSDVPLAHRLRQVTGQGEDPAPPGPRATACLERVEQGGRGQGGGRLVTDDLGEARLGEAGHGGLGHDEEAAPHRPASVASTRAKSRPARIVPRTDPDTFERVPAARGR